MSRSNPQAHGIPNPATRWFEWNGERGVVRYYDKDAKQNVDISDNFTFLLLDQVGRVGGWHNESDSAIWSNEVRDSRQEALIVKSRKGGTLAEGIYRDIKDRVNNMGGYFVTNCYIAYKNGDDKLSIGSLQFKGAALHAWSEFCRENRSDLYAKAIVIQGFEEGKKGRITFRTPQLFLKATSAETDAAAVALDKELQKFFASYFKRTKAEQAEAPHHEVQEPPVGDEPPAMTDDDIPF